MHEGGLISHTHIDFPLELPTSELQWGSVPLGGSASLSLTSILAIQIHLCVTLMGIADATPLSIVGLQSTIFTQSCAPEPEVGPKTAPEH
jgi:hypothetical protein